MTLPRRKTREKRPPPVYTVTVVEVSAPEEREAAVLRVLEWLTGGEDPASHDST